MSFALNRFAAVIAYGLMRGVSAVYDFLTHWFVFPLWLVPFLVLQAWTRDTTGVVIGSFFVITILWSRDLPAEIKAARR